MKIIPLAVVGLAALGAVQHASAQSEVTIYGLADIGLDYVDNQNGASNRYVRSSNVSGDRVGFRGSESLGDGTRFIYQLENGFLMDTGELASSSVLFNRQAFAGFSDTQLGTLTAGRQYTPYYWFVGPYSAPAKMGGSVGARPGDIDGLDQALRVSNSLSYVTPERGGFQLGLLGATGEQAGHNALGGAYSVATKYVAGGWAVALGHQVLKNGPGRTGWDSSASGSFIKGNVNAGYLSAAAIHYNAIALQHNAHGGREFMLGATVSNVQYRPDAQSRFAAMANFNSAELHSSFLMGPRLRLLATASYTREQAANGITAPANYRQISIEQNYAFSARTSVYLLEGVQWARGDTLDATGQITPALAAVGDSQTATPAAGQRQRMISLGIRHTF